MHESEPTEPLTEAAGAAAVGAVEARTQYGVNSPVANSTSSTPLPACGEKSEK